MNQKSKRFQTRMLTYGVLVVFCLIVIGILYTAIFQDITWESWI